MKEIYWVLGNCTNHQLPVKARTVQIHWYGVIALLGIGFFCSESSLWCTYLWMTVYTQYIPLTDCQYVWIQLIGYWVFDKPGLPVAAVDDRTVWILALHWTFVTFGYWVFGSEPSYWCMYHWMTVNTHERNILGIGYCTKHQLPVNARTVWILEHWNGVIVLLGIGFLAQSLLTFVPLNDC